MGRNGVGRPPTTAPEKVIALYRARIERAKDIVMAIPLDAPPNRGPTSSDPGG